jgi:iron only hydrogenase large subunit-like protein
MISAAREIGCKHVFDTQFGADMTIMEEGTELLKRLVSSAKGPIPLFTSCCPSWITFIEKFYLSLSPNLASMKSPHMMVGTAIKTYFAKKQNLDPEQIFTVSLMPCIAEKDEIERTQHQNIVDAVLTTREFANTIKIYEIKWNELSTNEKYDSLLGESSEAGALFGVTGGVAEAAIRFAHEKLTGEKLRNLKYHQ